MLLQFFANLYGIPVPAGSSDPDVFITLEVLNGDTNVGLYCNPGWGQYADVNANYPQPGYAVWQSGGRMFSTLAWTLGLCCAAWPRHIHP